MRALGYPVPMPEPVFSVEELRRFPDVEDRSLQAWDASDTYLLDRAAELIEADPTLRRPGAVVVIGDRHGALSLGARATLGVEQLRANQDALLGERAIAANAARLGIDGITILPLGRELLQGARLVLLQLPRALDALEEVAQLVASTAAPDVLLLAGGRIKHMSRAMNEVIGRSFEELSVSLARQKSRLLLASGPRADAALSYPKHALEPVLGSEVFAHGAAFNGTGLDIGTRVLIGELHRIELPSGTAIDLGCGTGIIATAVAQRFPRLQVIASDQSQAAVDSATATVAAAGVADRVSVVRDDGLQSQPARSAELVLLNPPFHIGAAVHTGLAERLFAEAARVLVPGGELWTVWNSHLGYRRALERLVGPTEQLARTPKFTLTRSRRRA